MTTTDICPGLNSLTTETAQAFALTLRAGQLRADVAGDYLVFSGGSHGSHQLTISVTSEVRALAHWQGYVENNTLKPAWGIAPPIGAAVAAWGARAIYSEQQQSHSGSRRVRPAPETFAIELLWDRQGAAGRNLDLQLLNTWINEVGLPRLRKECSARCITTDCNEVITFTDGKYTMTASPRESCGYLYIGAWVTA